MVRQNLSTFQFLALPPPSGRPGLNVPDIVLQTTVPGCCSCNIILSLYRTTEAFPPTHFASGSHSPRLLLLVLFALQARSLPNVSASNLNTYDGASTALVRANVNVSNALACRVTRFIRWMPSRSRRDVGSDHVYIWRQRVRGTQSRARSSTTLPTMKPIHT